MSTRGNRPDRVTLAAFGLLVLLAGANFVAVRFSNQELAPFWGAGLRFTLATGLFAILMVVRESTPPRGRALAGTLLYGLLGFAGFYAFSYWALVWVPATMGALVCALIPLLTVFLAVEEGLERFRWRSIVGAVVAAAGVVLLFAAELDADVPLVALLALVAAALCGANSGIVVKRLGPPDPVATNAVATAVGAGMLLSLSVATGEPRVLPGRGDTLAALAYLVTVGTVGVLVLYLYVLKRWPASSVAYQFVLAPFVTVALGALLLGEGLTPLAAVGAALVLAGVHVGALALEAAK